MVASLWGTTIPLSGFFLLFVFFPPHEQYSKITFPNFRLLQWMLKLWERCKYSLRISRKANGDLRRQAGACSILGYCCLVIMLHSSRLWCTICMPDLLCQVKWGICMPGSVNWAWQEQFRGQCLLKPFPSGHGRYLFLTSGPTVIRQGDPFWWHSAKA